MHDRPSDLCNEPLKITVHRGGVILSGPFGVDLAMTPIAAERSAALLMKAAKRAAR